MDGTDLTGRLLVAAPALEDPHFRRTVVLVVDDDAEGALGVVVNRPSRLPVAEVLADWGGFASDPPVMFAGGPVGEGAGLALGVPGGAEEPLGWRPLESPADGPPAPEGLGVIDLDAPPQILGGALGRFRVFAGYAGWSEGQLGAEIEEGAWYVLPALAEDVFSADPGTLWARVLRRQGGDLALVATLPDDPELN
ncbi:YqgE/AlgH family protein [Nocardiopsis chromatogenes]|uniref:YqgE/AlgH family protein n=1 Tax=Nocardiopsis chromatogenes TaxID=280239 RepID=UPI000347AF81|nr:YqgE/AlgH family protein [Nocardiopsis chromatogenes]